MSSSVSRGVEHARGCEHVWERAPDRDLISTPSGGGGFADLVFWCSKCATVKTERVDFPYRDGRLREVVA